MKRLNNTNQSGRGKQAMLLRVLSSFQMVRDVQRAQYFNLYLCLLWQQHYLYLYSKKSGNRCNNPVFVFVVIILLILGF